MAGPLESTASPGCNSPVACMLHLCMRATAALRMRVMCRVVAEKLRQGRPEEGSNMGQLSGMLSPIEGDRCTMQFDWHIQPHRLTVVGGREAQPIGIGAYGVVSFAGT